MSPANGYFYKSPLYPLFSGIQCVLIPLCPAHTLTVYPKFSITSAPEDPYVSVTISQAGDWTRALGEAVGAGPPVIAALAAATQTSGRLYDAEKGTADLPARTNEFYEVVNSDPSKPVVLPEVRIDGPYGAPSADVFRSDLAVLVGAGIGVTPFASILKDIWYRQRAGRLGRLRHVEFIWICRDAPHHLSPGSKCSQ